LNRNEDQFIIHPNWLKADAENNSKSDFDFMLISLSEHNIDMVKEIDPIKIASEPPIVGESYSVSGYGYIDNYSDLPTTLQITELNIAEDSVCELAYDGQRSGFIYNPEYTFCTAPSSATDSCNGDSGGPLFKDGKQYGTVSYGPSICADGKTPGAYGKLSVVLDWINEHAQHPTAPPTTATPTTATPTTAPPTTATPTTATPTTATPTTPTTPTTPAPRITPTTATPTTATPTKSMASSLLLKANLLFTLFLSLSLY